MISDILVLDPKKRPSLDRLLNAPWFQVVFLVNIHVQTFFCKRKCYFCYIFNVKNRHVRMDHRRCYYGLLPHRSHRVPTPCVVRRLNVLFSSFLQQYCNKMCCKSVLKRKNVCQLRRKGMVRRNNSNRIFCRNQTRDPLCLLVLRLVDLRFCFIVSCFFVRFVVKCV